MIPFSIILRKLGGPQRVIKLLGYPVNIYTIEVWKRDGVIPEQYRDQIADALYIDPKELEPSEDDYAPKLKYRKTGRVYSAMIRACNLKPKEVAARVHGVPLKRVDEWRNGYALVPLHAFEEIYEWLTSDQRQERHLTIDRALMATGLTQTELCKRMGVTTSMGTYWRRRKRIPEPYAGRILELISEIRAQAFKDKEELEACLSGD